MSQQTERSPQQERGFPIRSILKYAIAAAAGSVATLIVVFAFTTLDFNPTFSPQLPGIANLTPPDATQITVWDLEQLRQGNYLETHPNGPSPESFFEMQMLYLNTTPAVDPYEISEYLLLYQPGWKPIEVATGPLDFQYMELELEDARYTNRSYRGYEIWIGQVTYAFLPEHNHVVASRDEDSVKAFLNHFHRMDDLDREDDELPIALVLDQAPRGPAIRAERGRQNCPISRCQALSIAVESYNEAEEELHLSFSLLFRSEETAEQAAWDYDDVADHMESKFQIEVIDMVSNGRFVTGEATGGTKFLTELR